MALITISVTIRWYLNLCQNMGSLDGKVVEIRNFAVGKCRLDSVENGTLFVEGLRQLWCLKCTNIATAELLNAIMVSNYGYFWVVLDFKSFEATFCSDVLEFSGKSFEVSLSNSSYLMMGRFQWSLFWGSKRFIPVMFFTSFIDLFQRPVILDFCLIKWNFNTPFEFMIISWLIYESSW